MAEMAVIMSFGSLLYGGDIYLSILFGVALLFGGGFFVRKKLRKTKEAIQVLKTGSVIDCTLISISNSSWEHNRRAVKIYCFEYFVGDTRYNYLFGSAYHRSLMVGQIKTIFFLPEDPHRAFIPQLYSIYIKRKLPNRPK